MDDLGRASVFLLEGSWLQQYDRYWGRPYLGGPIWVIWWRVESIDDRDPLKPRISRFAIATVLFNPKTGYFSDPDIRTSVASIEQLVRHIQTHYPRP